MTIDLDNGEHLSVLSYHPTNKSDAVFIGEISLEIEDGVKCYMAASWDKEGRMLGTSKSIGDIPKEDIPELIEFFEYVEDAQDLLMGKTSIEEEDDAFIDGQGITDFLYNNNKKWDDVFLVVNELNKWEAHNKEPLYIETYPLFGDMFYYIPKSWKAQDEKIMLPEHLYPNLGFEWRDWTEIKIKLVFEQ